MVVAAVAVVAVDVDADAEGKLPFRKSTGRLLPLDRFLTESAL